MLARSVAHNHTPKPPKQVVEQWRTSHKGLRCLFVRALWESAAVKDFSSECDITRFEFSFFLPIIITTATRTMSGLVSAWLTYDQRRTLNEITNLLRRWQLQMSCTPMPDAVSCALAGCAVSRPCAAVRDFSVLLCLCAVKVFFETW